MQSNCNLGDFIELLCYDSFPWGEQRAQSGRFSPKPSQLFKKNSLFSPKISPLFIAQFHISLQTSRVSYFGLSSSSSSLSSPSPSLSSSQKSINYQNHTLQQKQPPLLPNQTSDAGKQAPRKPELTKSTLRSAGNRNGKYFMQLHFFYLVRFMFLFCAKIYIFLQSDVSNNYTNQRTIERGMIS